MKRSFTLLAVLSFLTFGIMQYSFAQEGTDSTEAQTEMVDSTAAEEAMEEETTMEETTETAVEETEVVEENKSFHQILKEKFIEGGPEFMGIVLLCLILGLAIVIERIIYLNMSTTNTKKLLSNVEDALNSGGVDAAKEVCRNTSGPVASIFYQGLDRSHEGIEMVASKSSKVVDGE